MKTKIADFISKMLREKDGKPSNTRFLTSFVAIILTLCLGIGFLLHPSSELGWAIAGIILGAIGVKNWHSVRQNTQNPDTPNENIQV